MTGYNPATDADKPITAGVLFTILQQFAQDMLSPRSEIIEALGYTPADAADLGEANGIATLGSDAKLSSSQIPSIQTIAGYTPSNSADEGVANGIATLGSDAKLSTSQIPSIQTIAGYTPADSADIGAANGIAELDSSGKVPASQLPSYVDDVIEVASYSNLPASGEDGKIYVTLDTGRTYRWSGSAYVEISNYTEATGSSSGLMSAADKTKLDETTSGVFRGSSSATPGDNDIV